MRLRAVHWAGLGLLFLGAVVVGAEADAARTPSGHPFLLIGMDGGEWSVIEDQWSQGKMPNLKGLVDRGVRAPLQTDYGWSPVIWTTIATGHDPDVHGITGFVVATPKGDVPVSSDLRKVPAIWNMTSQAGMKTHVLGWWGTWPAESISGINITERCNGELEKCATPTSAETQVRASLDKANSEHVKLWPGKQHFAPEDRVVTEWGPVLSATPFDFMAMYIHGTDPNSHKFWRYYRPEDFPAGSVPQEGVEQYGNKIPKAYRSADVVLGRVLDSAGPDVNVIIVSDHGFRPLDDVTLKVTYDFDKLLAELGFATLSPSGKVDVKASQMYTWSSALNERRKRVRFSLEGRDAGGKLTPAQAEEARKQLEAKLATVTYISGQPAFELDLANATDKERGGDFVVISLQDGATKTLMIDGREVKGVIKGMVENSGGHAGDPPGIFAAAGPDIDPNVDMSGIRIHDITPTLLYGMGLPIADDMAGSPQMQLFKPEFRAANPLKTVATYGAKGEGKASKTTDEDEAVLEQLRQLGYIE